MLHTARLILKPATIEDAENLCQLNSDPEVMRYTGDQNFHSNLEAQKIINENLIPQFKQYKMGRFMIFLKDGTFIGWCGLKYFPETDEVDLGYRLKRSCWGQGFATEASKACLEYGFNHLNLKRIIAKAMPENIGSIKVMQKLGMTFRGYLRDPTDPQAFILYDIFKSEEQP
jgi:ribosomal-protein-alanine N-acetyltransferase